MNEVSAFNQPIGQVVNGWQVASRPQSITLQGRYCDLVPLDPNLHAACLFSANSTDDGSMWTYLAYGPFDSVQSYQTWMLQACVGDDPLYYAIVDKLNQQALGIASYLRIDPQNGVIEVGNLAYSPQLQCTTLATEAMYLMMQYAFDLGYRRYEWKCNALNIPSCKAAERLGFTFEGIFRQAVVVKGRNRDTAWYSVIDKEWPDLKQAFLRWLDPQNFDKAGKQLSKLSDLTAKLAK